MVKIINKQFKTKIMKKIISIEKMRIEKWDGKYPSTMLGNSQTLLNLK